MNKQRENRPRDRPKQFYSIIENGDGTVDVYLDPRITAYDTDTGIKEFDGTVRVVRGVEPWPGMIDDIRARYGAWCDSGERIAI